MAPAPASLTAPAVAVRFTAPDVVTLPALRVMLRPAVAAIEPDVLLTALALFKMVPPTEALVSRAPLMVPVSAMLPLAVRVMLPLLVLRFPALTVRLPPARVVRLMAAPAALLLPLTDKLPLTLITW